MVANESQSKDVWIALATSAGLFAGIPSPTPAGIAIDGARLLFHITEAIATEFMAEHEDVDIMVDRSSTGRGMQKFCAGDIDIANASRPIYERELEVFASNGIELFVAVDAVIVVTSAQSPFLETVSTQALNQIWAPEAEGTFTHCNQVNPEWPRQPITLFARGADSGTFDVFTGEINGERGASRTDYTVADNDELIVKAVASEPNAMGYLSLPYYLEDAERLRALSIDGVELSIENIAAGEYPLARPLFVYVNAGLLNNEDVRSFIEYYLQAARDTALITENGALPLTAVEYDFLLESL
ncbi:MAG: phosphate ABC transporter substrate-binding protein PstS family protein [Leptolyngbyaceae cyanobacterium]